MDRAWRIPALVALSIGLATLLPAAAQQSETVDIEALKKTAPRVYIDCSSCDIEYIKTEITFVNYVRDRKEAQVHVLITTLHTGSGGHEYTIHFSGQNDYKGLDDEVRYYSGQTDTDDEVRKGLVNTLKLGLMRYVARTPISSRIDVTYAEPKKPELVEDKWKFWVFSIDTDAWFSGEQSVRSWSWDADFSASKVTPDLRIRLGVSADFERERYTYEGETIESHQESYDFDGMVVKGLGEHWSVGGYAEVVSDTYMNIKLGFSLKPAIEFNLFPYSQSTRRQLRFLYKVGVETGEYREETIYFKKKETLWRESLAITLDVKEKWGSVTTSVEGGHYFHDFKKYSLEVFGVINLNLFKGLNAYVMGGGGWIHDQVNLVKGEATLAEVLLRRRELATTYSYFIGFGLGYTFGSIYTNVVNPRFGRISSGGMSIHIE